MENWIVNAVLGAFTVAASVFGAAMAAKASVKVKQIDVDEAAYERADRITDAAFQRLENEVLRQGGTISEQGVKIATLTATVERVTGAFRVAIGFIERLLLWEGGAAPRPRIPDSLKEYLDPRLVSNHRNHSSEKEEPHGHRRN